MYIFTGRGKIAPNKPENNTVILYSIITLIFKTNKGNSLRYRLHSNDLLFCFAAVPMWAVTAHLWTEGDVFRCVPGTPRSAKPVAEVLSLHTLRPQDTVHCDPKTAQRQSLKQLHFYSMNWNTVPLSPPWYLTCLAHSSHNKPYCTTAHKLFG